MTIADFKKITLFGIMQDKSYILEQLQSLGCMHLVSIKPQKTKNITIPTTTLTDKIKKALLYLQDSRQRGQQKKIVKDFNADQTIDAILENQKKLRDLMDRRDFLQERIKDLSVWGDFVLPKKNEMSDIKFWFYKIKHKDIALIAKDLVVQEIYRDQLFVYLIVMSPEEPNLSALPAPRVHTGSVSLEKLGQELAEIEEKIDDLEEERYHFTRFYQVLKKKLAYFYDRTALDQANEQIRDQKDFFLIQGWVPQKQLPLIKEFTNKHELSMLVELPSANELPPTLLETYKWTSAGTELINFYQTPSSRALDPSAMVFFSFSIFFAMILADAGYGFIIALFTLFSWKWLGKFNASVWLKPLLVTISVFSIAYGIIIGSYFGVSPPANSILAKFKLLDINNFNTMMKLVIFIGCLHIIVANGMHAWFAKTFSARMESISFIIIIIGFMLLSWGLINHIEMMTPLSTLIIIIGLLMLMVFASDLPVTNFKSFVKRVLQSLLPLTQLSSLFGDILSYLRLFALGLAGASLSITFNQMAAHISSSTLHGHGWILGFFVLLLGQTLNFLLCVMGGVIHGLRLNYIEFFKWSIKEEGYTYAPLKKTEVSHE